MSQGPLNIVPSSGPDPAPLIPFPAETWGRLRREMIWTLGEHRAHSMMARSGVTWGQSDAIKGNTDPKSIDALGDVTRVITENPDQLVFESSQSAEAKEHLRFFKPDKVTPQCWMTAGYLTGLFSQNIGRPVYFRETKCVAKSDSVCRFEGKSRREWMNEDVDLTYFDEENVNIELATTREQLRLNKDRYQNLFEQSGVAIFIIDPDTGACLNANLAAAELTAYPREELIRQSIFDLFHPQEHHAIIADMKSLSAGAKTADRECSIIRKDGPSRTIAQSSKMLTYGGKRVVQTIMRDITELKISNRKEKDLQSQLVRSERLSMIGRLAAGVAHELKNPLGAIRNAIYYIRNVLTPLPVMTSDPHLKNVMKLAEEEIDAAVLIIGELLDFSRIVQLVPRKTLVNEILEKIPSIVNIPENIELVWDLDLTLPSAMIDPDRINQVFCNLANNAVQAMPQGGKLTIRSNFSIESGSQDEKGKDMIAIEFEDSGIGIEPMHLSKIFEPLFTTKSRGTGLGLAISRNIVEKHGGTILVRSQPGKGTSFTVRLPINPPEDVSGESL